MMTYREFQILHSETIGYFQLIEGDLKWIYSLMHVNHEYKMYINHDEKLNTSIAGTLILQGY